jgi:hypothetical protein
MSTFRPLSNFDIDAVFAQTPNYGGCLSKDQLLPLKSKFYVINMSDSDQPGTHWVLVYNVRPREVYYFDSFGQFPAEQVLARMEATGKDILRCSQVIQAFNSVKCGYYAILVAYLLDQGYDFLDIVDDFSTHRGDNEQIMKELFSR